MVNKITHGLTYPVVINAPNPEDILKMQKDMENSNGDYNELSEIGKIVRELNSLIWNVVYSCKQRNCDSAETIGYLLNTAFKDYQEGIRDNKRHGSYFVWKEYISMVNIDDGDANISFLIDQYDNKRELASDKSVRQDIINLITYFFKNMIDGCEEFRNDYMIDKKATFFILAYAIVNQNMPITILDPRSLDDNNDELDDYDDWHIF